MTGSESFYDGIEVLKAADRMSLEGIVSKRRDAPYRT
jgi:ATP-dependent DNA ligase